MTRNKIILFTCFLVLASSFFPAFAAAPKKAPAFSERDLDGYLQSTRKYAGQPLVVYFWATWCPACVSDVKDLKKIYETYHPKGIHFVSVSLDTDKKKLEDFVKEKDIRYPVLFDGKGWKNEIAKLYSVSSTPSFFVINKEGLIAASGSWTSQLKKELKKLTG